MFGLISAIVKAQFWPLDEASTCSVKVGQGGVINVQGNTKQGSVLCIAWMKRCIYTLYFLTKVFDGLVHTLNKDEGESAERNKALT